MSINSGVIGAAFAVIAVALGGCGKKPEPTPVVTPSAASMALEPLIQRYADLTAQGRG